MPQGEARVDAAFRQQGVDVVPLHGLQAEGGMGRMALVAQPLAPGLRRLRAGQQALGPARRVGERREDRVDAVEPQRRVPPRGRTPGKRPGTWSRRASGTFPGTFPGPAGGAAGSAKSRLALARSEEHTSELQSLMRISYAVFCLQNKNTT